MQDGQADRQMGSINMWLSFCRECCIIIVCDITAFYYDILSLSKHFLYKFTLADVILLGFKMITVKSCSSLNLYASSRPDCKAEA